MGDSWTIMFYTWAPFTSDGCTHFCGPIQGLLMLSNLSLVLVQPDYHYLCFCALVNKSPPFSLEFTAVNQMTFFIDIKVVYIYAILH